MILLDDILRLVRYKDDGLSFRYGKLINFSWSVGHGNFKQTNYVVGMGMTSNRVRVLCLRANGAGAYITLDITFIEDIYFKSFSDV